MSAISAVSSLIASTTGGSPGASQAAGLQKQLQALQGQLASADCVTCDDTRNTNQQLINRQIQKVQTQLAQLQPAATGHGGTGNRIGTGPGQPASTQDQSDRQTQAAGFGSQRPFSFSHLGGSIDVSA